MKVIARYLISEVGGKEVSSIYPNVNIVAQSTCSNFEISLELVKIFLSALAIIKAARIS